MIRGRRVREQFAHITPWSNAKSELPATVAKQAFSHAHGERGANIHQNRRGFLYLRALLDRPTLQLRKRREENQQNEYIPVLSAPWMAKTCNATAFGPAPSSFGPARPDSLAKIARLFFSRQLRSTRTDPRSLCDVRNARHIHTGHQNLAPIGSTPITRRIYANAVHARVVAHVSTFIMFA